MKLLNRLRSYSASTEHPFLDTLRILKATWKDQEEVQSMNDKLKSYQQQLHLRITMSGIDRQSAEFRNLDAQVRSVAQSVWDTRAYIQTSLNTQTNAILNHTDRSTDEVIEEIRKMREQLALLDPTGLGGGTVLVRTPSPGPAAARIKLSDDITPILEAAEKGDDVALRRIIRDDYSSVYRYDEKTGMSALSVACKHGHLEAAERLLRHDARVTHDDNLGKFPLHHAVEAGNGKLVRLLLQSGAGRHFKDGSGKTPADYAPPDSEASWILATGSPHIEAANDKGETALHHFSRIGKRSVVKSLLDQGANIEAPDNWKKTPIFAAADGGQVQILELLIAKGANIEHREFRNGTPLVVTAWWGQADATRCLLQHKADPNARNSLNFSALNEAVKHNHIQTAKVLLEFGVDTENVDSESFRPLDSAIACDRPLLVDLLLSHGSNISRRNPQVLTPLHEASRLGWAECVRQLLKHNAPLDVRQTEKQYTALHIAAMAGHTGVAEVIVKDARAKEQNIVNQGNVDKWTALHEVGYYGHTGMVSVLVENGADINAVGDGRSPLKLACQENHYETAKALLNRGADINHQGGLGNTHLAVCAHNNHIEIVKLLISRGADVDKANNAGYSALSHAVNRGNLEVARLLIEDGKADMEHRNGDGWTTVMEAALNGRARLLSYLLEKGADPEGANVGGETPLFMACRSGSLPCVKILVEEGKVDVRRKNRASQTSLMEAQNQGSKEVINYLIEHGA